MRHKKVREHQLLQRFWSVGLNPMACTRKFVAVQYITRVQLQSMRSVIEAEML